MKNFCCILVVFLLSLSLISLSCGSPLANVEAPTNCPVGCPRIFDPVCASDGAGGFQYFHNECLMRSDGCRRKIVWREAPMSRCLEGEVVVLMRGAMKVGEDPGSNCLRVCPFIFLPVCATDGQRSQVFGNDCLLAMERCLTDDKWLMTRDSDCGL